ncbi:esterase E4-like [Palaemon carinicauda]|uniref:esterase E4-like n=1 Tax=Palaemon carinicauda TaxID=392227 RepID=UPI0035B5A3FA
MNGRIPEFLPPYRRKTNFNLLKQTIFVLVMLSLVQGKGRPCCDGPRKEEVISPVASVLEVFVGDPRGTLPDQGLHDISNGRRQSRIMNRGPSLPLEERAAEFQLAELATRLGIVVGTAEFTEQPTVPPSTGRPFFSFRGIPYALPPVGRLRWREPEDLDGPWPGGRLDATQFRQLCPQYNYGSNKVEGQEDCLYLNVYTPVNPAQGSARLPVLVFLHGGNYLRGTASTLGPRKLLRENIVLVTVNFRIGILGFLSTRSEYLAGNYGLLDQLSALRWVQRNIAQFGGDPTRVTLGGFSSGASAVHLHMMSPLSKGLFHSAIMMSGAGNCVWSLSQWPEEAAYDVGRHLGCSTWSSWYLRECLMDKSPAELIKAQAELHNFVLWPMLFRPSIDGNLREDPFLPEPLDILMSRPPPNPVPVLIGGVPDEGILYALTAILFSKNAGSASQIYENGVVYTMQSLWPNDTISKDVIQDIISFYYSQQAKENMDVLLQEMSEAFTDLFFTSCIWDAAEYFASSRMPVFTYLMTHRLPTSPSYSGTLYLLAESVGLKTHELYNSISHGDDLALLFSLPFDIAKPGPDDQHISSLLTFIWATFTHTGAPPGGNSAANAGLPLWTPLVAGDPVNYYTLSFVPGMSERPFRNKEQNFWSQTLVKIDTARKSAYSYSVASWVLLTLCLLFLLILLLVGICVWKARRKNRYPGGSLSLKRRITRNPSLSSSGFNVNIASAPSS